MQSNTISTVLDILCALEIALATPRASAAEDLRPQDKRYLVWGRAVFSSGDMAFRVDSRTLGLAGTLLDLEKDLGIDEHKTLAMFGAQWRIAKRHALDLAYFELNRSGNVSINEQIRWDDFVYPIDANVGSFFDTRVTRLAYRYSLVSNPTKEFAIGGGIHWTDMEAGIDEVSIGSSKVSSAAPLPLLAVSYHSRISTKWSLQLLGEWFDLDFVGLDGAIWHADAALVWQT